jgi:hypothetical protein
MEAEGHAHGQANRREGFTREILSIKDDDVARIATGIVNEGHDPTAVLVRIALAMNERGFKRDASNAVVVQPRLRGCDVVFHRGSEGQVFAPVRGIAIPIGQTPMRTVQAGEFAAAIVEYLLREATCRAVERPPGQNRAPLAWTALVFVEHARVARNVDDYRCPVIVDIHNMKYKTARRAEPLQTL